LKSSLDNEKQRVSELLSIIKVGGSFQYETFCHILRKRSGGWQGYLAEMLHPSLDNLFVKRTFWLIKLSADFLFLRQPFVIPNLSRQLNLTKDDLASIIQQNCQIREQIIHCFVKYYRRNSYKPAHYDPRYAFIALLDSFDGPFMQIYADLAQVIKGRLFGKK